MSHITCTRVCAAGADTQRSSGDVRAADGATEIKTNNTTMVVCRVCVCVFVDCHKSYQMIIYVAYKFARADSFNLSPQPTAQRDIVARSKPLVVLRLGAEAQRDTQLGSTSSAPQFVRAISVSLATRHREPMRRRRRRKTAFAYCGTRDAIV